MINKIRIENHISLLMFVAIAFYSINANSQCRILNKEQRVNFGFGIEMNYPFVGSNVANLSGETIAGQTGFGTSLLLDYFVSEHFYLSPKAEMTFNTFQIDYVNLANTRLTTSYNPVTLDFLIHSNFRIGNGKHVPYLIAGPNFKIPMTKSKAIIPDFYTSHSLGFDFGIGLENKTNLFNFSPEIRYSFLLINAKTQPSLTDLRFNLISLLFNFKQ